MKRTPLQLMADNQDLLAACKQAMYHLTAEKEEMWRESQRWEEAPYHFLYLAIIKAEGGGK